MEKFEVGDLVQLKNGSDTVMKIVEFEKHMFDDSRMVVCVYFTSETDDTQFEVKSFPESDLKLYAK